MITRSDAGILDPSRGWQLNHHSSVFHARRIRRLTNPLVQAMLAAGHIELPAVPWTSRDIASQRAFAQRSAGVRADPVDYMKHAIDVVNREDSAVSDNLCRLSWSNRCGFCQIKGCHISRLYFEVLFSSCLTCSAARRTRIMFPPSILWMESRS